MASGKYSPRQKVINLMYLVFLAMIAMSVSAEVLEGYIDVKKTTDESVTVLDRNNNDGYAELEAKVSEFPDSDGWKAKLEMAMAMKEASNELYAYITELSEEAKGGETDYGKMDKSEKLDNIFFGANGLSDRGREFTGKINSYKQRVALLLKDSPEYADAAERRFFTGDANGNVVNREGASQKWLSWAYELQPLVGSLAKLSLIQNNIKITESEFLSSILREQLNVDFVEAKEDYTEEINLSKLIRPSVTLTKLNVLYRGIENDMEVYLPGVHPSKVRVRGAKKVKGSEYVVVPSTGKHHNIKVSGTLSDGTVVARTFEYRIKSIPRAETFVGSSKDGGNASKSMIESAKIKIKWEDFPYKVEAEVKSFRIRIPGQPSMAIQGNKLTDKAKRLIRRARNGDEVRIFDIEAKLKGNSRIILKRPNSVTLTLI